MPDPKPAADLLRQSRREALIVLAVWAVALVWTVGYCYLFGYRHPPDSPLVQWGLAAARSDANFRQVLGLPDWVLVGILLPWLACTAFTILFSLFGMKDADLGAEAGGGDAHA
jgi:hypothetical protein